MQIVGSHLIYVGSRVKECAQVSLFFFFFLLYLLAISVELVKVQHLV